MLMNYQISRLKVFGRHGVADFERERGQHFFVDLSYQAEWGGIDDIAAAVSYADVAATIEAAVKGEPLQLIETLAERILDSVFSLDERIRSALVTVHKPSAPMPQEFEDVSVTLAGERE
jgi:dihydroneopterin aldolase